MNDFLKRPLVAICIPTYEKLDLFKRIILSIQNQTYDRYIVVVTDNSVTNDIEEYVKKYNDDKIKYYHNEQNLGASGNANQSIKFAIKHNADIIKILFQDDWFTYNNSLEKMVKRFVDTNADVLFTGNIEAYMDKKKEHICTMEQIEAIKDDFHCIYRANVLGAPSNIMYKASEIFFDTNFIWLLDVDFYLRILKGKRIEYMHEPLITIGHDGEQLTDYFMNHYSSVLKETLSLYRKHKDVHNCKNRIYIMKVVWMYIKLTVKKVVN